MCQLSRLNLFQDIASSISSMVWRARKWRGVSSITRAKRSAARRRGGNRRLCDAQRGRRASAARHQLREGLQAAHGSVDVLRAEPCDRRRAGGGRRQREGKGLVRFQLECRVSHSNVHLEERECWRPRGCKSPRPCRGFVEDVRCVPLKSSREAAGSWLRQRRRSPLEAEGRCESDRAGRERKRVGQRPEAAQLGDGCVIRRGKSGPDGEDKPRTHCSQHSRGSAGGTS